ncbi:MAG: hypothetical protein RIT27_1002 [Pseudomonadota bacterium]
MIGEEKLRRLRLRRRFRHRQPDNPSSFSPHLSIPDDIPDFLYGFIQMATRLCLRRATNGNQVVVYHSGKESFQALIDAVSQARGHVHLEYYIFHADETGRQLGNLLVEKVKQGVECRLLVDFIGCWGRKRWDFLATLRAGGVDVGFFLPVVPWKGRVRMNFRNHRKIAIIDGSIGFTGSQNIGNEYVGLSKDFSIWHDTHLKIMGPAVADLQEIFANDWWYATRRLLRNDCYYPPLLTCGDQVVHILPSGPDINTNILHHLLFAVISAAQRNVHIATPYFVPDSTMLLALEAAAYRGVEVTILVPAELDMPLTLWAGRSYYRDLLLSGVDIYEYQAGMMHSKVVIVDDTWGMVGSANMDIRSFRLNFETSVFLYNQDLAKQLEDNFQTMLQDAKQVELRDTFHSFGISLRQGFARLISPML